MLTAKQLKERKSGIGGSDCAAVLGLSKWRSPFEVYVDKITPPDEGEVDDGSGGGDGPLYIGSMLEPFVRSEYAKRAKRVVTKPKAMLRHAKYPWLIANPDGIVKDSRGRFDYGWEGKVIGTAPDEEWGEEGSDQVPVDYLIQCQHYMLVTGLPRWDLSALIGNRTVRTYVLNASPKLHEVIIDRTHDFWVNHVQARVAPLFSTADEVRQLFTKARFQSPVQANDDVLVAINALSAVRAEIKRLEDEASRFEAVVLNHMGEHDGLVGDDERVWATWKNQTRKNIDVKKLRDKYPQIAAACEKTTETRVFLLKEPKGDSK